MKATLYLPHQSSQPVLAEGMELPDPDTGLVGVPAAVPMLLECAAELVDVLASGPGFVAYSIFDSEGELNPAAMAAVGELSGVVFDLVDEDHVLRGPVLVIKT